MPPSESRVSSLSKFTMFILDAKSSPGDSLVEPHPLPKWVDPKLLQEGQAFFRRNLFSIFFSHFISLLLLFCYGPIRRILLKTGNSDSTFKSLQRYFSTIFHIKFWYEQDLLADPHPSSQGLMDVLRVRRIHMGVSQSLTKPKPCSESLSSSRRKFCLVAGNNYCQNIKVNQDNAKDEKLLEAVHNFMSAGDENANLLSSWDAQENDPRAGEIPGITQLDMLVTQFCFMGLISLRPKPFGIFPKNRPPSPDTEDYKGLEGFVHLWALLGHFLGIEDRFNLCLERNKSMRELILEQILIPEFRACESGTLVLWRALVSALSLANIPCLTLNSILYYTINDVLQIDPSSCTNPGRNDNFSKGSAHSFKSFMTWYEQFCYRLMSSCFSFWIQFLLVRLTLNSLLDFIINRVAKVFGMQERIYDPILYEEM